MGSGKTTIGKKLAKKLNYQFVDLDELIENKSGISIAEYFEEIGEDKFRILERDTLRETFQLQSAIISTGGGAPCFFSNLEEINTHGMSIYLKTDVDLLISRLKGATNQRPLIKSMNSEELKVYLKKLTIIREEFYLKAKLVVNAKDLTAEKLVLKLNISPR
jgi:shikimate kinase